MGAAVRGFFRGEAGLGVAYWGWGVAGSALVFMMSYLIFLVPANVQGVAGSMKSFAIWALVIGYAIFIAIGVVRSASRSTNKLWSFLAQASVILHLMNVSIIGIYAIAIDRSGW